MNRIAIRKQLPSATKWSTHHAVVVGKENAEPTEFTVIGHSENAEAAKFN